MSAQTGPYVCVCGVCRLPMEVHPVDQCPYEYDAVKMNGRVYGYRMRDKKQEKKKNGLRRS